MAAPPGYDADILTYAQRNPQTIQLSDGVRIRKTDDYYVVERLKADLSWEELTQIGAAVWGDITGTLADQTDVQDALDDKQDTITDVLALTPTASPPGSPAEGMIYADTDHHLYFYNGTTWLQLDNAP